MVRFDIGLGPCRSVSLRIILKALPQRVTETTVISKDEEWMIFRMMDFINTRKKEDGVG
jgi:hypothetical protein